MSAAYDKEFARLQDCNHEGPLALAENLLELLRFGSRSDHGPFPNQVPELEVTIYRLASFPNGGPGTKTAWLENKITDYERQKWIAALSPPRL